MQYNLCPHLSLWRGSAFLRSLALAALPADSPAGKLRVHSRPRLWRGAVLRLVFLVLAVGGAGLQAAQAASFEKTLSNGLKVIVREDHRAATAIQMIWYRAGSIDEVNGRTGVAHVLEHMMFKGTETYGDGVFSRRVAAVGGRENAFTNRDYTGYFQQVPPAALPEVMTMEADRMRNLRLQPEDFAKEIEVIMEERRQRVEDSPFGRVGEQLMAIAFNASPYRAPVIGWMNDLENLDAADAQDWYHSWYAPNNAVLVVAGDVRPEEVFALAEQHYGSIPRKDLARRRPQIEPLQRGIRRAIVKAPADSPYVVMGFKVPHLTDGLEQEDAYALEMLAAVLGSGDTGRLTRELVRDQQLANDANASYGMLGRGPELFTLSGTPVRGKTVDDIESALREQMRRIATDGVQEEELRRIKAQYVAGRVFARDSFNGQIMEIGLLEMVGLSYRDIDALLEKVSAVTPAQVQKVAGKYFGDDQLTVITLDPQPLKSSRLVSAMPSDEVKH